MFLESNIPVFDLIIIDYNNYYILVHDYLTTPTAAGLKTRLLSINQTFMTCPIAPASLVGSGHSQRASIISRLKTSPLSMILLFPKLHCSEHRPKHGLNCWKHPTRIGFGKTLMAKSFPDWTSRLAMEGVISCSAKDRKNDFVRSLT